MRLLPLVMLALLAFPAAASADSSIPLYYSRDTVAIDRKSAPQQASQLPWQKTVEKLSFDVEVRDGMTLYNQKGWFNLSSQSEKNGVLLVFPDQGLPPIVRSTQYAPVDILLIDHEGNITQIVPNIKLSELSDDITPASPILAFLFLKGGLCEKMSIRPGDVVEYKTFTPPPVVLSAPKSPPP